MPSGEALASPRARRRRRERLLARWLIIICLLAALAVAVGWPVYVRPQADVPRRADAIFVIGGYDLRQYSFGIHLAEAGWASTIVMSNPTNAAWLSQWCNEPHPGIGIARCVVPDPPTTLGEGRELRRLAAENGWRSVIVVAHRPHVSRARFIIERCFNGELIMVEPPGNFSPLQWAYQYVYQTAGYIKAFVNDGC